MNNLDKFIEYYGEFEIKVQKLINQLFGQFCAECHDSCCRIDVCEEANDSLFLRRVREATKQELAMNETYGWLDISGCCLGAGRPPICSEYLCEDVYAELKTPIEKYIARVLCLLITFVGENAVGDLHLCEILHESDMEKVDPASLMNRLEIADEAFNAVCYYCEHGKLNEELRGALEEIMPFSEEL